MGLARSEIRRFFIYKVFFTTILESIFQGLIAIIFIIVSQDPIDATILLSLVTTLLTLIVTLMQFLRQFETNVIELNWRLEFTFDSSVQRKISRILRYNKLNKKRFKKQLASELHIDPRRIQLRNIKVIGRTSVIVDGLIYSIQLNKDTKLNTISLENALSVSSVVSRSASVDFSKFTPNDVTKMGVLNDYVRQWKYQFPTKFVNCKYNRYDMLVDDSCCVLRFAALIDSNNAQLIKDMICRFFFGRKEVNINAYNDKFDRIKLSYLKENYMDSECISQWCNSGDIIKYIDSVNMAQVESVGNLALSTSPSTDMFYKKIKSISILDINDINDINMNEVDDVNVNVNVNVNGGDDVNIETMSISDQDNYNEINSIANINNDNNNIDSDIHSRQETTEIHYGDIAQLQIINQEKKLNRGNNINVLPIAEIESEQAEEGGQITPVQYDAFEMTNYNSIQNSFT